MSLAARRRLSKKGIAHTGQDMVSLGTAQPDVSKNLGLDTTMHDALAFDDELGLLPHAPVNDNINGSIIMAGSAEQDLSLDRRRNAEATLRPQTGRGKVVCQTCTPKIQPRMTSGYLADI